LIVFRFACTSNVTGGVRIGLDGGTYFGDWSINRLSGEDTGGTNGSNVVVQATKNSVAAGAPGPLVVTLGSMTAGNATFGAFGSDGSLGHTPGSGFTSLSHSEVGRELETQWKATTDTSVDWTWSSTDTRVIGIALELKAAPSGGGPVTIEASSYGATGNGVTDDRAALQNAMNALGAGDSLHLAPGTYMISQWLVYDDDMTIYGDDPATTTIKNLTTRSPADQLMLRPNGVDVANFAMHDLTFDARADYFIPASGYSSDQICIDLSNTIDATVTNVWIRNAHTQGFYGAGSDASPIVRLTIQNGHVFESSGDGISTFGAALNMVFDNNFVENTQDDAIAIQDATGVAGWPVGTTITNNRVSNCDVQCPIGCTPAGIRVFGAAYTFVADNVTDNTYMSGLVVSGGAVHRAFKTTLQGNRVTGAGSNNDGVAGTPQQSIMLYSVDSVYLAGNSISDNAAGAADYLNVDTSDIQFTGPAQIGQRGSASDATSTAVTDVTVDDPTTARVGNYLIARVAMNNSGTSGAACTLTVTDDAGNAWTVLTSANKTSGAPDDGATAAIAYCKMTTAFEVGDQFHFATTPNCTAKAIKVDEWTWIHPTSPIAVAATQATGTSGTPSVSRTATAVDQLVYCALAWEGDVADGLDIDHDTTNGPWINQTAVQGGASGTATNNITVWGGAKIVTAAGAQSWDPTITSRDWAAVAVVFAPETGATPGGAAPGFVGFVPTAGVVF
jgi:hypothetical protein